MNNKYSMLRKLSIYFCLLGNPLGVTCNRMSGMQDMKCSSAISGCLELRSSVDFSIVLFSIVCFLKNKHA